MHMKRRLAGIALAAVIPVAAGAAEPIKVGAFLSTTGPVSLLGDPEKKVLDLYVAEINKSGGVLGRPLQLISYDDSGAADKATSFAKRLVDNDNVDIIIGGSSTATTMAAVPTIEKAEVPFCSMGGAVVVTEPVKKWTFRTPQTDRMAAEKILIDMKNRGISRIGLLSEDAGFGKSGRDQTLLMAQKVGVEVVSDQTYSAKDPDVTSQLTKIRAAPGVQAVLNFGFGQSPAVVTKNFRQLGLTLPLYQSHGVASQEFINLAGEASEGVRLPASGLMIIDELPATDPQRLVVADFKKKFEATYKTDVSAFGGYAFDCLQIMLAAIQRAGSTDKSKIRDELERTSGYIGTSGTINMSATDHTGLNLRDAFRMVEVRGGKFKLID